MNRSFTLRISDIEDKELPQIRILSGTNSDNSAINHCIRTYCDLTKRYNDKISENKRLREELEEIKKFIHDYNVALATLSKIQ